MINLFAPVKKITSRKVKLIMQTLIINFSGRQSGNCHHIGKVIQEISQDNGNEVVFKEMYQLEISPCGKCNYECKRCPYISDDIFDLYSLICSSKLVYYIVPNYCDAPNANFFIFKERSQSFFQNQPHLFEKFMQIKKKFIVVSNTEKDIFVKSFKFHVAKDKKPDILFLAGKEYKKSVIKDNLMLVEEVRLALENFINN